MRGLSLSSFKKIAEDKHSATMQHEDGHKLIIAKDSLKPLDRKQLEKLPMHKMADGGQVDDDSSVGPTLGSVINYPGANPTAPKDSTASSQSKQNQASNQMARGGKIQRYADGTDSAGSDTPDPSAQNPSDQTATQPNQAPYTIPIASSPQSLGPPPGMSGIPASAEQGTMPQAQTQAPPMNALQAQQGAFEEEKAANLAKAAAIGQGAQAESATIGSVMGQVNQAYQTHAQRMAELQKRDDDLYQAMSQKQIDPDHYWQSHSKIAAGIGMILGGIGGGLTGRGGNAGYDATMAGINRDIQAQKDNMNKQQNLYGMNLKATGNELEAFNLTQNQLLTGLKYKLDQAAAKSNSAIALQNAKLANARIDQQLMSNNFRISLMNPLSDNPDPATRVQFLVPPEQQKKVFDEIDAAKNTVQNADGINDAFWQASQDARPMTGGLGTSPRALIPGMKTPGQQALIARLGPTFQDVEGTVRQSAMDNMEHNVVPALGDSDATIQTKWKSLQDYMASKQSAATAKGFGIDLSRFPSTSMQAFRSDLRADKSGQVYRRGPGGKPIPVPLRIPAGGP